MLGYRTRLVPSAGWRHNEAVVIRVTLYPLSEFFEAPPPEPRSVGVVSYVEHLVASPAVRRQVWAPGDWATPGRGDGDQLPPRPTR
jgi:hypothetical protein